MYKEISTKKDLLKLKEILKVRPDWHEPDEQEVTAEVLGKKFDNAGFPPFEFDVRPNKAEIYVFIYKDKVPVAKVNLATLFAWATGYED
jgi:hypothetical protein